LWIIVRVGLDVHRPTAFATLEEVPDLVKFVVG
jgi:hypothetical protein